MTMQQNLVPDNSAAIVVHPTPGIGDATTIQEAVNMLPAAGGRIFIREGNYSMPDTVTLPDKSVDIVGSGGTVLALGNLANTPLFTIPDGLTARRTFTFSNFKVTSNSRVGSSVVSIQDSNARGVVTVRNVDAVHLASYIEITDGDGNFLLPVTVDVHDAFYEQTDTLFNQVGNPVRVGTVCALVNDNGISNFMEVSFTNFQFMVDEFSTVAGSISGDSFGSLDLSLYNCDMALGGEEGFSTLHAERCRIWNFTGTPQIWFINGGFISDDYVPQTHFINCNVLGIWIIDLAGMNVTGGWWINTRIETSGNNSRSAMVGVAFHGDTTSAATFPVSAGVTAFFGDSGDISIEGCTFSATGGGITYYIDAASDFVIKGCSFRGLDGGSTAGIHISGVNNYLIADDFDTDNWGCPPIQETGSADRNVYNDCLGVNGNGGVDSVFIGVRNTFNGLSQFRGTGATVDAFTTVTTQVATSGLGGIGNARNTGAKGMTVQITVTDQYGTTVSTTTNVAPGNDTKLDPTAVVSTAVPPYTSYKVEIKSQNAGQPTTYDVRLGMNSEVSW